MKIMLYEMSGSGGFAIYCKNLANKLANSNDCEVIINTVPTNKILNEYKSNVEVITNLEGYTKLNSNNKLVWLLNRLFVVIKNNFIRLNLVKNKNIDIININQLIPRIDQFFIKRLKSNTKVIITVHDVIPPVKSNYWSYNTLKACYDAADYLIIHSEENQILLINEFNIKKSKTKVIEHGIEVIDTCVTKNEARTKLEIEEDEFIILFFGSIRESKGLDILIRALENNTKCLLLVAGSCNDNQEKRYISLAKKMNANVRFDFKYIDESEVQFYYRASDLLALPYKDFSSQSGVLMQAITYSLPVIATDVSSFKTFIDKYNIGRVVNPNDVNDLKIGINYMINNKEDFYMYKENAKTAKKQLSWSEVSKKHISFYKDILREG